LENLLMVRVTPKGDREGSCLRQSILEHDIQGA
jgi:hypothetical protein